MREGEIFEGLFGLLILAVLGLVGYGVVVIVFRLAFGVELPNPVDWLPAEWAQELKSKNE